MKIGKCTCGAEFKGASDEEVMKMMGEHAASAHPEEYAKVAAMSQEEQASMMKGMIREE